MNNITDRIPPQDVECEKLVLGAVLLESEALLSIINIITPETFYSPANRIIYSQILDLYRKGSAIDLITVMNALSQTKKLDKIGGPAYLSELTSRIGSSAHIEVHARIIYQKYMKRELIKISSSIQRHCYDEDMDVSDVIDKGQSRISSLILGTIKKEAQRIGDIGRERLKVLEKNSKEDKVVSGVKSWDKLDKKTGGWQPSDLIIIAARPSMGKSRIAAEIAKIASQAGTPVGFFSLEMSAQQLYERELSAQSGIENMRIRTAKIKPEDWHIIEEAQSKIEQLDIIIDDTPALTITEFRAKATLYQKKFGLGLIIVDYLQLMKSPSDRGNREREISNISSTLKDVAKSLDIPIIALSQLNRKLEERRDKTPVLSDIRESGAIEQDADVIAFIHRPEYYEKNVSPENENLIQFIFAKHRNGAIGNFNFWHSPNWSYIFQYKSNYEDSQKEDTEDLAF